MTIGERIHAARKSKGLSQEMIAAKLGVSRQAVTRWESGKSNPSTSNLLQLSALLEIPIGELCGTPDPAQTEAEQLLALSRCVQDQKVKSRKQMARSRLSCAGVLLLGYAAVYLLARLLFVSPSDYTIMGWLFGNDAARQVGYLYGWLCQQGLFLFSLLFSVFVALLGQRRLGLITLCGFIAGLVLGELLGPYPDGASLGRGHYGWLIWGIIFLCSILMGCFAEWMARRKAQR